MIDPRPSPEYHYGTLRRDELHNDPFEQFNRWHGIPYVGLRISNIMEPHDYQRFPGWQDDPMVRRWNLWGYVDGRDVAQAVRLSLESHLDGAENFLIAAADTCMSRPSMDLMREVFPDVPITEPVDGTDTLLSIAKARAMLDYGPRYAWRDQLD